MDRLTYLKQVIEAGRAHMAPSREAALAQTSYHGVDSFQGLYLELAEMELARATGAVPRLREYIIDKGLRWQLRDILDQLNINERMIYPGTAGIAKWLARHYYVKMEP